MKRVLAKILGFGPRLMRTVKASRQVWKRGGVTQISVAQINRGEVLSDKRILITGGSAGIGLAIARKCLMEGAEVVITGRNQEKLNWALQDLGSSRVYGLVWDVAAVTKVEQKLAEVIDLFGREPPDVLVNNAGLLGGHRQFIDLSEADWDRLMSVNCKGLVFLTQSIVRRWLKQKAVGKVINISSMRGTLGVQDGPYGMSKWALNGLTHGLGCKLAPHGIIVNGIAPGIIATESINIKGIKPEDNGFLGNVPAQRIGLPEEIAELAVFLISDASNYIVGQTIVCDGGYTLKV